MLQAHTFITTALANLACACNLLHHHAEWWGSEFTLLMEFSACACGQFLYKTTVYVWEIRARGSGVVGVLPPGLAQWACCKSLSVWVQSRLDPCPKDTYIHTYTTSAGLHVFLRQIFSAANGKRWMRKRVQCARTVRTTELLYHTCMPCKYGGGSDLRATVERKGFMFLGFLPRSGDMLHR